MKRPQFTKRTLVMLLLFIVCGAIINVAVAWGCAIHNTRVFLDTGFPCWGPEPYIREPFPMRSFEYEPVIWIHKAYRVPIAPLWPGFAINTIFYAGILWLLFTAPGFVLRRMRVKRGLCPACAYPTGESDVCTECGTALPQRSAGNQQP